MQSLGGKYMLPDGLLLVMVELAESAISAMKRPVPGPLGPLQRRKFMSDALSFVEIDGQHVELLPARTVMSLFSTGGGSGGKGGAGGGAQGGLGINILSGLGVLGTGTASAGDASGGGGGNANGG
jgi:hypothetical protein